MKAAPLLTLLVLTLISCHTPKATFQKLDKYPMESTIFAEIKIKKKNLVNLLNQQIDKTLQQPISNGNIQMSVARTESMSMSIMDDKLHYALPIQLDATMGRMAKAKGKLTIWLKSDYEFLDNWTLNTSTQVADFQWTEAPKAELFGLKFPIEQLSNFAINQFGPMLVRTIDEQMKKHTDFRTQIQALLDNAAKPILVDTAHNLWLTGTPKRFGIAPFFDNGETILSSLYNSTVFTVHHQKPATLPVSIPKLEIQPIKNQQTQIHINAIFTADSLSELMNEQMVGTELAVGKKKVKIEDIQVSFAGRLLRTRIKVSGGINGFIDGSGAPYMNEAHSEFKIDDFDMKLTGSNMLIRSGVRLFRKKIQNTLEETINQQIQEISNKAINKIRKDYTDFAISPIINLSILPDNQIKFNFEHRSGSLLYLQISLNGNIQLNVNANGTL